MLFPVPDPSLFPIICQVYLVHGVAATCGVVIIVLTYKQLVKAAAFFRTVVSDALSAQMKNAMVEFYAGTGQTASSLANGKGSSEGQVLPRMMHSPPHLLR